jgi:putative transposase
MIERCRGHFPIKMMCRLLKVSTSGYYDWRVREPSQRAQENSRLARQIGQIHQQSDGVFGSPRIWEELRYLGQSCSLNRVARLMKLNGLVGIPAVKQWRRRAPAKRPEHISNHLKRNFSACEPNVKWVSDITYVRTGEGWLYLAVVIDLYNGLVVGWSMSCTMEKELVIQAVVMALWKKQHEGQVILHSDRGSQYTSYDYQQFLQDHHIVSSMSAVGNCYDNAAAESFFGVLKRERVNRRQYATRAEARSDIFDYIERFYNRRKERKLNHQPALNMESVVSG